MPSKHLLTDAIFLGVDDENSKEELWRLFDALAFKLMLRTQIQDGLKGDEGEMFWTELIEKHPKILLVTALTTDKAQTGIFVSTDAVDRLFDTIRAEDPEAPSWLLTRFLIDHPHVPVLQAAAMFITTMAVIEMSKNKEDPLTPFPSSYIYIRQPPPLSDVVPPEIFWPPAVP